MKNHTGAVAITNSIVLSTSAHGIALPDTLDNTVLLATDSIDLVQPAHTTNNGATVVIYAIARA